jgi:hypothetical protein
MHAHESLISLSEAYPLVRYKAYPRALYEAYPQTLYEAYPWVFIMGLPQSYPCEAYPRVICSCFMLYNITYSLQIMLSSKTMINQHALLSLYII